MTDTHTPQPRSGLITGFRWVLAILAGLFTLGAFTQFFLVGVSFFDDAARWRDHANLGNVLGLLTYLIWVPAVLGRTGRGAIMATVMLFILYMAQHASLGIDNTTVNALHPLNGAIMLVLAFRITQRAVGLLRHATPQPSAISQSSIANELGRTPS